MLTTLFVIVLVIAGLAVLVTLYAIGEYNALVTLRNRYKNAFSQIDVQLKRRYDLIPNLVETAKGYLKHERETLEAVIAARNQAAGACGRAAQNPGSKEDMAGLMSAEAGLAGALSRLFALVEAYPDLKANQTMASLMEELTSTENKIGFARQAYNDQVMAYNTRREIFPSNIIASIFNFQPAELFAVSGEEERTAPKVTF